MPTLPGVLIKNQPANPRDSLSRTGFIVKYVGCPIVWSSKQQTTVALSTTEAECMALSSAAWEVIFWMNSIDELRKHGVAFIEKKLQFNAAYLKITQGQLSLRSYRNCHRGQNTLPSSITISDHGQ